jgi:hypothetical protein
MQVSTRLVSFLNWPHVLTMALELEERNREPAGSANHLDVKPNNRTGSWLNFGCREVVRRVLRAVVLQELVELGSASLNDFSCGRAGISRCALVEILVILYR